MALYRRKRIMQKKQASTPKQKKVHTVRPSSLNAVRSVTAPESSGLLALQGQIGNGAVQRLLAKQTSRNTVQLDLDDTQSFITSTQDSAAAEELSTGRRNSGRVIIRNPVIEQYDVNGSTLSEVINQLDPEEWGRCQYHFDYGYDSVDGRATQVNITLRLVIRLPRWTNKAQASPDARREWQRMVKALHAHEEEHAAIARRWAPIFKQRMVGQAEGDLDTLHVNTLADVNTETEQFDQKTQHGQTTGVSLNTSIN